jgi:hypothetical protein
LDRKINELAIQAKEPHGSSGVIGAFSSLPPAQRCGQLSSAASGEFHRIRLRKARALPPLVDSTPLDLPAAHRPPAHNAENGGTDKEDDSDDPKPQKAFNEEPDNRENRPDHEKINRRAIYSVYVRSWDSRWEWRNAART